MEYGVVVRWWLLYQVLLVVGLPFAARVLPDAPDRGGVAGDADGPRVADAAAAVGRATRVRTVGRGWRRGTAARGVGVAGSRRHRGRRPCVRGGGRGVHGGVPVPDSDSRGGGRRPPVRGREVPRLRHPAEPAAGGPAPATGHVVRGRTRHLLLRRPPDGRDAVAADGDGGTVRVQSRARGVLRDGGHRRVRTREHDSGQHERRKRDGACSRFDGARRGGRRVRARAGRVRRVVVPGSVPSGARGGRGHALAAGPCRRARRVRLRLRQQPPDPGAPAGVEGRFRRGSGGGGRDTGGPRADHHARHVRQLAREPHRGDGHQRVPAVRVPERRPARPHDGRRGAVPRRWRGPGLLPDPGPAHSAADRPPVRRDAAAGGDDTGREHVEFPDGARRDGAVRRPRRPVAARSSPRGSAGRSSEGTRRDGTPARRVRRGRGGRRRCAIASRGVAVRLERPPARRGRT